MSKGEGVSPYDENLPERLAELRRGDPAYKLHEHTLWQAIIFAAELHGDKFPQRILDAGCGLGFMTVQLNEFQNHVVGIDPSTKAIELAKAEHGETSRRKFYASSAEQFPATMAKRSIKPFDQAILNMVLHSVDDETVLNVLKGVNACLRPEGTIISIVPTEHWLMQKLIEYAQDEGMKRAAGIAWVDKMLHQDRVDLPVRIRKGSYYPQPLTIFNRSVDDYARLLRASGYGFSWNTYDSKTQELLGSQKMDYLDMNDYYTSNVLFSRDRLLLMSFTLPPEN